MRTVIALPIFGTTSGSFPGGRVVGVGTSPASEPLLIVEPGEGSDYVTVMHLGQAIPDGGRYVGFVNVNGTPLVVYAHP